MGGFSNQVIYGQTVNEGSASERDRETIMPIPKPRISFGLPWPMTSIGLT